MGAQIGHATEDVEVHKDKVIGGVEQFVLTPLTVEPPACEGHQIEGNLQQECDDIEGASTKCYE